MEGNWLRERCLQTVQEGVRGFKKNHRLLRRSDTAALEPRDLNIQMMKRCVLTYLWRSSWSPEWAFLFWQRHWMDEFHSTQKTQWARARWEWDSCLWVKHLPCELGAPQLDGKLQFYCIHTCSTGQLHIGNKQLIFSRDQKLCVLPYVTRTTEVMTVQCGFTPSRGNSRYRFQCI